MESNSRGHDNVAYDVSTHDVSNKEIVVEEYKVPVAVNSYQIRNIQNQSGTQRRIPDEKADIEKVFETSAICQLQRGRYDSELLCLFCSIQANAKPRPNWSNKTEFLMSCIATSVGLGNIWRFPFTAYENGGGAFLIPYIVVLIIIGKPMYYLEMIMGQFTSQSSVKMWHICPPLRGNIHSHSVILNEWLYLMLELWNVIVVMMLFRYQHWPGVWHHLCDNVLHIVDSIDHLLLFCIVCRRPAMVQMH